MLIRLSSRRQKPPLCIRVIADHSVPAGVDLAASQSFPLAEGHLLQPGINKRFGIIHKWANDFCGFSGAAKRAHVQWQLAASKPRSENAAELLRLVASKCSERRILLALKTAVAVPLCFSVTDKVDFNSRSHAVHARVLSSN